MEETERRMWREHRRIQRLRKEEGRKGRVPHGIRNVITLTGVTRGNSANNTAGCNMKPCDVCAFAGKQSLLTCCYSRVGQRLRGSTMMGTSPSCRTKTQQLDMTLCPSVSSHCTGIWAPSPDSKQPNNSCSAAFPIRKTRGNKAKSSDKDTYRGCYVSYNHLRDYRAITVIATVVHAVQTYCTPMVTMVTQCWNPA